MDASQKGIVGLKIALCLHCAHNRNNDAPMTRGTFSIWFDEKMIEPDLSSVAPPNSDLETEIIDDYNEAASILNKSPRGSAALLRLCIQKLCKQLGEKGEHINTDIGNLVKKGLPIQIQQALDYVRVIGNNALHPGQIDIKDNHTTASTLFQLVNRIASMMITQPKLTQELFCSLPDTILEQIEKKRQINL